MNRLIISSPAQIHICPSRSAHRIKQCLRAFQVRRSETFGEPVVDGGQNILGFGVAVLLAAQPRETGRSTQFPELGTLLDGNGQSREVSCLGSVRLSLT